MIAVECGGSLERWIGIGYGGFGLDGNCWAETGMGQLDWESLVEDNF